MLVILSESPVMRKSLGLFLFICGAQLYCAPMFAADTVRDNVLDLLRGYEWQLDSEQFQGMPADTHLTVISIIEDESIPRFIRGRAMEVLTLYPNDDVWDLYQRNIQQSDNVATQRRFVQGSCEGFMMTNPQGLADLLVPLLENADAHLRAHAANCLGRINAENEQLNLAAPLAKYERSIVEDWERRVAGLDDADKLSADNVVENQQ